MPPLKNRAVKNTAAKDKKTEQNIMGMRSLSGEVQVEAKPKKTYQGRGKHTKYAATASNKAKKRYRGQGR